MTPGSPPDPEGRGDPRLGRLLRWYPRAWRDRYGEEFLALVEDTLDGGRPGWRLRLGVVRAGLQERVHQAGSKAPPRARAALGLLFGDWGVAMMAVFLYAGSLGNLTVIPLSASAYHRTATLAAIAGFAVIAGLAFLARGLTALPALIRFLRAGGWPKIRRRAAWAVAATAVAAGGLTWFFLMASSMTYDQINRSPWYTAGLVTAALLAETAFVLWRSAARATARQLGLQPRMRAAQLVLAEATRTAAWIMLLVVVIWSLTIRSSSGPWLDIAIALLFLEGATGAIRVRLAWHRGQRLRARAARVTSSGRTG